MTICDLSYRAGSTGKVSGGKEKSAQNERKKMEKDPERVCRRRRRMRRASMTLETAFVLPLFFMAVLTMIVFMDALRLQLKTNLRLSNEARRMSEAAGAVKEEIPGDALWIDLRQTETFSFPFTFSGLPKLGIAVRARVYPWCGCQDGISCLHGDDDGGDAVFVTDYESVWHSHADCTHLDISVMESDTGSVGSLRNFYGRRYRPCSGFPSGYEGPVYLTEKGDYYYPDARRAGLTRHVRAVRRSEMEGRCQCARCAARDAA